MFEKKPDSNVLIILLGSIVVITGAAIIVLERIALVAAALGDLGVGLALIGFGLSLWGFAKEQQSHVDTSRMVDELKERLQRIEDDLGRPQ